MLNMSDLKNMMNNDKEPEYPIPEDMEGRYRLKLCLSEDLRHGSIYQDMEPDKLRQEATHLQLITEAIDSDEDYETWKEEYLKSEFEKLKGTSFIVCEYGFAGVGEYSAVIPKSAENSFMAWVNSNMSAVFKGVHPANEEDMLRFIALNAVRQNVE